MASRQQDRKDFDVQRAAYLCAERGLTQAEIGRVLGGLSQSRVSRLLKRAEERGWLVRSYRFVPEKLPAGRYDHLRRLEEPSTLRDLLVKLRSRTGIHVSAVHVVDSGSSGSARRTVASRLARFGRAAVGPLDDLLGRSTYTAVSWGRSVSCAVDSLRQAPALQSAGRSIHVVPVCGEPTEQQSNRDTSSHLAERLHEALRSSAPKPPSLTGVPALIPRHFTGSHEVGIRKFVTSIASYRDVFGTADPLISRVDTLLTSVGPAKRPLGFIHEELLKAGSRRGKALTSEALEELVAGDIGGVLLPRPGLSAKGRQEVAALNAMWTGATLAHYERIARAAARMSRPGIVVLSIGGDGRAEIIAEAVRHGLIGVLVIDRSLAEALAKELAE